MAARTRRQGRCGSRCRRPPTTGSRPTWRRGSSWPAAGCASSTPTRDDIFYDEGELTDRDLQRLAAPQRDLLRGAARRPARLLLGGRAAADPERPALPGAALAAPRTGGSTRCAIPTRWSGRWGRAAARTLWVGRQSFALDVTRAGRLPRPGQLHPLLVDRPRQRLPRCGAATGPWPAPRTRASSESPPTSPSAAPGMP